MGIPETVRVEGHCSGAGAAMIEQFKLHLSERTTMRLLRDPQLPDAPTFRDMRNALARIAKEDEGLLQAQREHSAWLKARREEADRT